MHRTRAFDEDTNLQKKRNSVNIEETSTTGRMCDKSPDAELT